MVFRYLCLKYTRKPNYIRFLFIYKNKSENISLSDPWIFVFKKQKWKPKLKQFADTDFKNKAECPTSKVFRYFSVFQPFLKNAEFPSSESMGKQS